ncbi:unnamed protein product, partial [Lymnaea stagnalis]
MDGNIFVKKNENFTKRFSSEDYIIVLKGTRANIKLYYDLQLSKGKGCVGQDPQECTSVNEHCECSVGIKRVMCYQCVGLRQQVKGKDWQDWNDLKGMDCNGSACALAIYNKACSSSTSKQQYETSSTSYVDISVSPVLWSSLDSQSR